MEGYAQSPISNIRFTDVVINGVETEYKLMNVKNIQLKNVTINGQVMDNKKLVIKEGEASLHW